MFLMILKVEKMQVSHVLFPWQWHQPATIYQSTPRKGNKVSFVNGNRQTTPMISLPGISCLAAAFPLPYHARQIKWSGLLPVIEYPNIQRDSISNVQQ